MKGRIPILKSFKLTTTCLVFFSTAQVEKAERRADMEDVSPFLWRWVADHCWAGGPPWQGTHSWR